MPSQFKNLGDLIKDDVDLTKIAIIDLGGEEVPTEYTYAELDAMAMGVARALTAQGFKRGDRIAILSANRAEYLAAYYGIMRAGLVAVPVNYRFPKKTIELIIADAGAKLALPAIAGRGKPLIMRAWIFGEPLASGQWGIREPMPEAPEVAPDILIVPLGAFGRAGHRIGYGAGYYDMTIAALRAKKLVTAIGVAFALSAVAVEALPKSMCRYSILAVQLPARCDSIPAPTVQPALVLSLRSNRGATAAVESSTVPTFQIPASARPPVA